MMVSTKGRYALRALIDMAEQNTGEYIPLKEIAKRQEISEKYLESILPVLAKAGFLDGVRGKGGGYKFKQTPDTITVGSIIKLLEGTAPVTCLECMPNKCGRMNDCRTLPMWQNLQMLVDEYLEGITIADLCNPKYRENNYVI